MENNILKINKKSFNFLIILSLILYFSQTMSNTYGDTSFNENALDYIESTLFGGSNKDHIYDIALDSQGNRIIVGDTGSEDFFIFNAYQSSYGGGRNWK